MCTTWSLSTVGTKSRNRGEKQSIFFVLRGKNGKNDFFRETFLLKLLLYSLEGGFLCAFSRPAQQVIPTFCSYRAQTPITPYGLFRLDLTERMRIEEELSA
jgi:hypothetical protein